MCLPLDIELAKQKVLNVKSMPGEIARGARCVCVCVCVRFGDAQHNCRCLRKFMLSMPGLMRLAHNTRCRCSPAVRAENHPGHASHEMHAVAALPCHAVATLLQLLAVRLPLRFLHVLGGALVVVAISRSAALVFGASQDIARFGLPKSGVAQVFGANLGDAALVRPQSPPRRKTDSLSLSLFLQD